MISPTAFFAPPATLSAAFSVFVRGFLTVVAPPLVVVVRFVVVVVVVFDLGFATRPVVTLLVRGLLVFALVLVLLVVRFLGAMMFSICCTIRGLELPLRTRGESQLSSARLGSACLRQSYGRYTVEWMQRVECTGPGARGSCHFGSLGSGGWM